MHSVFDLHWLGIKKWPLFSMTMTWIWLKTRPRKHGCGGRIVAPVSDSWGRGVWHSTRLRVHSPTIFYFFYFFNFFQLESLYRSSTKEVKKIKKKIKENKKDDDDGNKRRREHCETHGLMRKELKVWTLNKSKWIIKKEKTKESMWKYGLSHV